MFPFEHMAKAVGLPEAHLGCRIIFSPLAKIAFMVQKAYIGDIRSEIASMLDVVSLREILTSQWKSYLEHFHVCITDAVCVFLRR